ncbi:hypothetical protein MOF32_28810, partial [Priestia megaterium]|uniref:hypothetical protein n=1 Tax=Priestia megaterium TaxID=1404 RepID=UPI00227DB86B
LAVGWRARRKLPRKAEPCTEINSGVTSSSAHLFPFSVFRLDSFYYVPTFFSCKIKEYKLKNLYLNERRDDESERY